MDGKALARLAAIVMITLAGTAAAVFVARDHAPSSSSSAPPATSEVTSPDPLHTRLQHCAKLGEAAVHDADCLAAWAESRRRFLMSSKGR